MQRASTSFDKAYSDEFNSMKKRSKKTNKSLKENEGEEVMTSFDFFSMQTDTEVIIEVRKLNLMPLNIKYLDDLEHL